MRNKRLLQLLVLAGLILALGVMPALGNTLTMTQDHSLNLSLSGSANLAFGIYDPDFTYAFAQGFSTSTSGDEGPVNSDLVRPTASVSGTYFPTTTATIAGYHGSGPYVLNQSMVAIAPAVFGSTFQQTTNSISLIFQADSAGDAIITLTDTLTNMLYGVSGPGYPDPAFITISGSTFFTANIFSASNPSILSNAQTLLDDSRTGIVFDPINGTTTIYAVPNFTGSIVEITPFTFNLFGLAEGELVYLDLFLNSTLDTQSATVPVPPSVWLFGSGLLGLWGMRRRLSHS